MSVPIFDKSVGMCFYGTSAEGIDGRLGPKPEDFIVEEIDNSGVRWGVTGIQDCLNEKDRFLHFTLVKDRLDTPSALRVLARGTGIPLKFFSYAGLKDKYAKTSQRISVYSNYLDRIRELKHSKIMLKDFTYSHNSIQIGDLYGNGFRIRILVQNWRDGLREKLDLIMKQIRDLGGAPNFYGHQRFGTVRSVNHQVGKLILKRRFKEAVMRFLSFKGGLESAVSKEFRENILEGFGNDFSNIDLPEFLFYEKVMIRHLRSNPGDYIGCFLKMPRDIARLFVHSYQSYLFNLALTDRWINGIPLNEAVKGDIVFEGADGYQKYYRVRQNDLSEVNRKVKTGRYKIVLPIIGYDSKFPSDEVGECILRVLGRERIRADDFYIAEAPLLSGQGSYRSVLSPVYQLSFEYDEAEKYVNLNFSLEKGCYATVVLREFLKRPLFR